MSFNRPTEDTLLVRLAGSWKISNKLPSAKEVQQQLKSGLKTRRVIFDTQGVTGWDTGLLTFLIKVIDLCSRSKIDIDREGLPEGVNRLLALAAAVPEQKGTHKESVRPSFLSRVGTETIGIVISAVEVLSFIGEVLLAFIKLLRGKARFRRSDLFLVIQDCGAQALPIVTIISLLIGVILAFVGAIQLKMFGAQIYVANLVGLGMVREMGAMMAAIIMAGRTGAAFAAQLGTMQVNEEIDALSTFGISPMEFLVLPRILALTLMMPLLCLYANFIGILGGTIVGVGMLDLTLVQYFNQTAQAITLNDVSVGLTKSAVFGILVAVAGCMRGMQCGRSSLAVGAATTSAVVTGIVLIIVSDATLTVIYSVIGI
jgi:phospholipid/cholesterol/gamma-HCH transport system permease protein